MEQSLAIGLWYAIWGARAKAVSRTQ